MKSYAFFFRLSGFAQVVRELPWTEEPPNSQTQTQNSQKPKLQNRLLSDQRIRHFTKPLRTLRYFLSGTSWIFYT